MCTIHSDGCEDRIYTKRAKQTIYNLYTTAIWHFRGHIPLLPLRCTRLQNRISVCSFLLHITGISCISSRLWGESPRIIAPREYVCNFTQPLMTTITAVDRHPYQPLHCILWEGTVNQRPSRHLSYPRLELLSNTKKHSHVD